MPGLLIWAVPRSRSTALERAFMQRPDTTVRHEDLTVPTLAARGGANIAHVAAAQALIPSRRGKRHLFAHAGCS